MKARTMSWDWKSQPDFNELARLVTEVTGVKVRISVEESGTDQNVIVISSGVIGVGDVVAVLNHNGEVAYFGEVQSLPTGDAALRDTGKIGVWNSDTDEIHYVAAADGEAIRQATLHEADAYLDEVIALYGEDHEI